MRYLKYFESQTEVSLKQKLESIVDMCDYLWSIDAADSLEGFYGKCSALFSSCLDINQGWSRGGRKPYEFNVDCLVDKLETSDYRRKEKLESIERLYYLSTTAKKSTHTKSEIRELIQPILDYEIFGGKVVDNIEITQHYNWHKQPTFSVKISINADELSYDKDQNKDLYRDFHEHASMDAKKKLKEIEKEFYRLKELLKTEFKKINFDSHGLEIESTYDYAQFGELNDFTIHLKEV